MIAIALPMPSACTTRFCASRCSISISVCFRSRTCVAAIFSATASATSFGYWMLPTTALMTAKGVSLVRVPMRLAIESPTSVIRSLISSPFSFWTSSRA